MPSSRKSPLQLLSLGLLRLIGWKVDVQTPPPRKCVIIGAHHTTNWDLIMALFIMGTTGYHFHWLAKDTAFRGIMGPILRVLGGIPVNRRSRNNLVEQMQALFESRDTLMLAITPEGTRSKTRYWKTGFYRIAEGVGVPMALAYADYRRKMIGFGPVVTPTGDIEADLNVIREFYNTITGKYPEKHGIIQLRAQAEATDTAPAKEASKRGERPVAQPQPPTQVSVTKAKARRRSSEPV